MFLCLPAAPAAARLPADVHWSKGFHPAGIQGLVHVARACGDHLVIGGSLTAVRGRPLANIARCELVDGVVTNGAPMGDGLDAVVLALAEHDGDLVAGGRFTRSGQQVVERVARWDGKSWQPIGAGLPGVTVQSLASYGGQLHAGAYRWDGQAWANVLQTNGDVRFLAEHAGLLYVGGSFTTARGVAVNNAFAWDGVNVQPLGAGLPGPVVGMAVVDGAVAFATTSGSGLGNVALWSEGAWTTILTGRQIESIAAWGDRLAVSYWWRFNAYLSFPYLRAWQDGVWSDVGGLTSRLMFECAGDLMLAADTDAVPGVTSPGLIAHDGTGYRAALALDGGCDDGIRALAPLGDGVVAAGEFRIGGGASLDRVAVIEGEDWAPWGAASDLGSTSSFCDVAVIGDETWGVCATPADDYIHYELCRLVWQDGQASWQPWPWLPLNYEAKLVPLGTALYALYAGTLMMLPTTSGFPPAPLPELDVSGYLSSACLHEGSPVVAGRITANSGVPCGHVLRSNGSAWEDLGHPDGAHEVDAVTSLGADGLAAAWRAAGGVARDVAVYDGAGWRSLGGRFDGSVTHLVVHRDFLFAAGDFDRVGDVEAHGLAMWTGSTWVPVGSGVSGGWYGRVTDLFSVDRDLWLCGNFTRAGGRPSAGLARWRGDPAAMAAASGLPPAIDPRNVRLRPASPNPFNPRTELAFALPVAGRARLRIHDARGALVRTLVDDALAAGEHRPQWDGLDRAGRPMPSGAYFARLEAGGVVEAVKLVLVR